MFRMKVHACHRCKVYVTIIEDYTGDKLIKNFDRDHRGHPRGSVDVFEMENYENVDEKYFKG